MNKYQIILAFSLFLNFAYSSDSEMQILKNETELEYNDAPFLPTDSISIKKSSTKKKLLRHRSSSAQKTDKKLPRTRKR